MSEQNVKHVDLLYKNYSNPAFSTNTYNFTVNVLGDVTIGDRSSVLNILIQDIRNRDFVEWDSDTSHGLSHGLGFTIPGIQLSASIDDMKEIGNLTNVVEGEHSKTVTTDNLIWKYYLEEDFNEWVSVLSWNTTEDSNKGLLINCQDTIFITESVLAAYNYIAKVYM